MTSSGNRMHVVKELDKTERLSTAQQNTAIGLQQIMPIPKEINVPITRTWAVLTYMAKVIFQMC